MGVAPGNVNQVSFNCFNTEKKSGVLNLNSWILDYTDSWMRLKNKFTLLFSCFFHTTMFNQAMIVPKQSSVQSFRKMCLIQDLYIRIFSHVTHQNMSKICMGGPETFWVDFPLNWFIQIHTNTCKNIQMDVFFNTSSNFLKQKCHKVQRETWIDMSASEWKK